MPGPGERGAHLYDVHLLPGVVPDLKLPHVALHVLRDADGRHLTRKAGRQTFVMCDMRARHPPVFERGRSILQMLEVVLGWGLRPSGGPDSRTQ